MSQYPKIAYIMSRFPHLSETFILREIDQLSELGWPIFLYPIVNQSQPVIHLMAEKWLTQVEKTSLLSLPILTANIRTLFKHPLCYSRIWLQSIAENISSLKFLSRTFIILPKAVYFAEKMQAEGITHIHAHYASHPALMAWVINQLTGISYSITVHAHDIFVKFNMLKTKLHGAKTIVAISEYNISHLEKIVGKQIADKSQLIHCGIDLSSYLPDANRSEAHANEDFQIINIGSLQPYKGHKYLIEACDILRDRGISFHCRIIGEGEDRSHLTNLIEQMGLTEHVSLLGSQTQDSIMKLLPTADCYVQPSIITRQGKMEGIPVSLMEALATRLPVIATDLSGIPELVHPEKTGYLVPPANSEALAEKLIHVYENRQEAVELAKAGRKLVTQSFSLTNNVRQLSNLFEGLVAESSSSPVVV